MSFTTNPTKRQSFECHFEWPVTYGSRLLPCVLDEWGRDEPDRLYVLVPRSPNVAKGFVGVTMRQMTHAVDVTAWWLIETFGSGNGPRTLAYVGPSDSRYPVLLLAAIKTEWEATSTCYAPNSDFGAASTAWITQPCFTESAASQTHQLFTHSLCG